MSQPKKFVFLLYFVVLMLFVLLPINNEESKLNHTNILSVRLDYIGHTLLFSPWMLLKPKVIILNSLVWLLVGLSLSAFAECLQYFLPYRTFSLNDLIANILGVLLGLVPFYFLKNSKKIETTFN